MSRRSDHRLRTICEFCKQYVRLKGDKVRHHSRPQDYWICPGSGAEVLWTVPRSEATRGRPVEGTGEDK